MRKLNETMFFSVQKLILRIKLDHELLKRGRYKRKLNETVFFPYKNLYKT